MVLLRILSEILRYGKKIALLKEDLWWLWQIYTFLGYENKGEGRRQNIEAQEGQMKYSWILSSYPLLLISISN